MIEAACIAGFVALGGGIYYLIRRGQKMRRDMGQRYDPPQKPPIIDPKGRW
jgi:hypothetical protein